MKSIAKRLQKRRELLSLQPRIKLLESELSHVFSTSVQLRVARSKCGFDSIFFAKSRGERLAVVRIINPERVRVQPAAMRPFRSALSPTERLNREWNAYSILSKSQLAPEPIWRTDDAIACRWIPGNRLSVVLKRQRRRFWELASLTFTAIEQMHSLGIRHFDLNSGNFLYDPKNHRISIIDFEYDKAEQTTDDQARAWDFLKLTNDLIRPRRGGSELLKNPDKYIRMLSERLPESPAILEWMKSNLPLRQLTSNEVLWQRLLQVSS